jgi:transcriptional regulator of arginine metabolism
VTVRQTLDATVRAIIAAPAAIAAYRPDQSSRRNIAATSLPFPTSGKHRSVAASALANTYSRIMQGRPLSKEERQRLVTSVIASRRIGTQHELMSALEGAGCRVTQATVSRDIRELGIEKTRDPLGQPRYALPEGSRRGDPQEALAAVLSQFGRRAVSAQNLLIVRCELGTAPAVARALDRMEDPRVLGTLAGDDTCLVVVRGPREARAIARELRRIMG